MRSAASKRVLWLTETAALTALLIILQTVTKPAGQYVTGSCVNAVLAVSALAVGVGSGLTVALLSPFFAVFVALLGLLAGGRDLPLWRSAGAVLAAAVCKFGALYLLVVKLLCTVLPLKEPQIAAFTVMFSYPQLVTALAGGAVGLLLAPVLRRALKR